MDELLRYGERLWALDRWLRANTCVSYGIPQLFGYLYELREWDCKNLAFDSDKLFFLGVSIRSNN